MTTKTATPSMERTMDQDSQSAKQGLLVFALFLIPLSIFGYWFNAKFTELPFTLPVMPLMFAPGMASILTRLVRREGFQDVSFRLRGPRMKSAFVLAYTFPMVVGGLVYGSAYLFGLARPDPQPFPFPVSSPLAQYAIILAFAGIAATLITLPTTAGEEIGWRGYLLPRLIEAGIPQPVLCTSLIWGVWHLPVVFLGVFSAGPSVWTSAVGIVVTSVALGYILATLRLGTGSVWPSVLAHAAWNAFINAGFTFATQNPENNIWIGEKGILLIAVLTLAAVVIGRSWKPSSG